MTPTTPGTCCEPSDEYSKDELEHLHFYCQYCAKEMEHDEKRECPARTSHKPTDWRKQFDETVKNIMRTNNDTLFRNETHWLRTFVASEIAAAIARTREAIIADIDIYLSYYNPIGDEKNAGKHAALSDLKARLQAEQKGKCNEK